MDLYSIFKTAHIAGVVLWIGPPLGAYWVYLRGFRSGGGRDEELVELRVRRGFVGVLMIEHLGLLLLVLAGLGMLHVGPWGLAHFWIKGKILIALLILLPIEILDIWWGQIAMGLALKKYPDVPLAPRLRRVLLRYDRFVLVSIPVLLVSWATLFLLAVVKPSVLF